MQESRPRISASRWIAWAAFAAVVAGAGGAPTPATEIEPVAPEPRGAAAAAVDSETGELVLFGGWTNRDGSEHNLADCWRFDGTAWRRLDAAGPSARSWATLTYDPLRRAMVLFGGKVDNTEAGIFGDTWLLVGDRWRRVETVAAPSARAHHAAAWDSTRGRLVLYGGQSHAGALGDLWFWQDGRWNRSEARGGPSARAAHVLYDDPAAGGVVVHGGSANPWPPINLSDRWLVTDSGYRSLAPAPARALHLAATTPGGTLISGGWAFEAQTVSASWLETPEGWRRLDDEAGPPPRAGMAWAVDPKRGTVYVFGGSDPDFRPLGDFWRFADGAWQRIELAPPPAH